MDIADLSQDGSAADATDNLDGDDVLRELIHKRGYLGIKLLHLAFERIDLLQEAARLHVDGGSQKAHMDGLARRLGRLRDSHL